MVEQKNLWPELISNIRSKTIYNQQVPDGTLKHRLSELTDKPKPTVKSTNI